MAEDNETVPHASPDEGKREFLAGGPSGPGGPVKREILAGDDEYTFADGKAGSQGGADGSGGANANRGAGAGGAVERKPVAATYQERLAASTEAGGLKELPADFDKPDGDWKLINSSNPFEVLYLDYRQHERIGYPMVAGNYALLEAFWKNMLGMMATGGNRVSYKARYGEGTVDNSLQKLKRAYDRLNSDTGIEQYFLEINGARLKSGEMKLKDSIESALAGGVAVREKIALSLGKGPGYDLSGEETAYIIKKELDAGGFVPYGTVSGAGMAEQLLSVDSWMTPSRKAAAEKEEAERERAVKDSKVQILPGRYASNLREIGTILFEDPAEAKEIIREDLLKQLVAMKDMVVGREVGSLSKGGGNIEISFLSIVYKLNPSLPFRFAPEQLVKTVEELVATIFETPQSVKLGKDHFKKGYIEIWLRETNAKAYERAIRIRDTAANADLAFLEFLYTFVPTLPYRFGGTQLVRTPQELCLAIDKSKEGWEAGKTELFDSSILVWLSTTGHQDIVKEWEPEKEELASRQDLQDIGLEYFLHLLAGNLQHSKLSVDKESLGFPKIQSGQIVRAPLQFSNITRGCLATQVSFSKELPGVSLSSDQFFINNITGQPAYSVNLQIDSNQLLKGVDYATTIVATTFEDQRIEIPVSFRIVFPRNAFWLQILLYAGIVAAFFAGLRVLLGLQYPGWISDTYHAFIEWDQAIMHVGRLAIFGWTFFAFVGAGLTGLFFLGKFLIRKV